MQHRATHKGNETGVGGVDKEMASSIMCLPCKHRDLSLGPQQPLKSQSCSKSVNLAPGRQWSEADGSPRLMTSKPSLVLAGKDPISTAKVESNRERYVTLTSDLHTQVGTHAHAHKGKKS